MKEQHGEDVIHLRSDGQRRADATGPNYWMIRIVYMRILGLVWLFKGLYEGALIIGVLGHSFHELSAPGQASIAIAAIGDCIAGVGLWLTVSWGGVIWIAASLVEIGFAMHAGTSIVPSLSVLIPILAYVAIVILSRRQVDRQI